MMKKILRSAWLGIVLLFMYLPILILAVYSFSDTATIGTSGSFSTMNYVNLFTSPELLGMIGGTCIRFGFYSNGARNNRCNRCILFA